MTGIYLTEEDSPWGPGVPVSTQSMVKAFLQCPREVYYKYVLRLQPKRVSTPLTRGKWIHALLETYYKSLFELDGEPTPKNKRQAEEAMWQEHRLWSSRFNKLFDEEKDRLGDLPNEIGQIMRGYFWHYGDPAYASVNEWKVIGVEQTIEAMLPNGHIFRGRYDMMVENEYGIWLVDHKSHKKMPDWAHRMMDYQAPMYTWASHQGGIPVNGFIWNYLITKPASSPYVIADGSRFSKTGWDSTTYPLALAALKKAGAINGKKIEFPGNPAHTEELKLHMKRLRSQRWAPGQLDSSPFYRRDEITHEDEQVERVVAMFTKTSERMHEYDYSTPEMNTAECKGWKCSYASLAMADLVSGDSSRLQRIDYQHGDPLEYYEGSDADSLG